VWIGLNFSSIRLAHNILSAPEARPQLVVFRGLWLPGSRMHRGTRQRSEAHGHALTKLLALLTEGDQSQLSRLKIEERALAAQAEPRGHLVDEALRKNRTYERTLDDPPSSTDGQRAARHSCR
jgi:hypothetical protein